MRFKSAKSGGFQVFAVSGVHSVSFGITATDNARTGLLGFAVERDDPAEHQRYYMYGFKVFPSVIPHPDATTTVSTFNHPIQSFVWDDFTAKPGRDYTYYFHPLRGQPKNLDRTAAPVEIAVQTEPLFSALEHDVFFNRGVASSQAYANRFDNLPPDKLQEPKRTQALEWLSRELDEAILAFIARAKAGDGLLGCFYEFRYPPVADALKQAITRGVDVRLIVDAKVNETVDKQGKKRKSFPRLDNIATLSDAGIPDARVVFREARPNDIAHNKFMVLLKGSSRQPTEVWTGSTNLSMGGIHGQTNVGHWVRNRAVATAYRDYWTLVSGDPGARKGDTAAKGRQRNAEQRKAVEVLAPVPETLNGIPAGVTPIFSPRTGTGVLDLYFDLLDSATMAGCITLAFGITKDLKDRLQNHTTASQIIFLMLEKRDKPTDKNRDTFVAINARNNVYSAWGSYLRDPLYQWTKETNAGLLGLNQHVSYVHSKFLLRDPLGDDPIVVTGSANFSPASTNANDENMLIIRGDTRVADIYFTEFNRIFNHYYFRAVTEATRAAGRDDAEGSLFLKEKAKDWLVKYKPGLLRQKRVAMFAGMKGFT
jgi:phosphatidylserine/phosphatidylglycerophosphate/cardiolipin synthase-like enzyme